MDEIAARKGALCEKLEPVLHAFSALGAAVCAPDDVNDGMPCITHAVNVMQEFEEEASGAEDDGFDDGYHEDVAAALFSSSPEPHALLRTFQDFVGSRGPARVIRALIGKMPRAHGVQAAPTLRKVVHHAHRHQVVHHAHHRQGRDHVLNAREGRRSKRFLLNQAPIALTQFGEGKVDVAEMLDSLCTPCIDSMLSAAAGVVQALAPYAELLPSSPMGPQERANPRDFVLMAQYIPTICIRASSTGEVCIAEPVVEVAKHKSLEEFATPEAVCGECGLSRARLTVALASVGYPTMNEVGLPSHPLFAVAAASREPYAASWELDNACEGNGEDREDICYVPALAYLTELMGNGTVEPDVAMTRRFTKMMTDEHIPACLHSLGKHQPWLEGIHDEFVQPAEKGVCAPACKTWLTSLSSEHGCCAPHLAAQHFTYSCPPAFEGSCQPFTTEEADAVVAALSDVCDFAPPLCPACGDALVFVVPAPEGEATDLSEANTHVLAEALRADLAAQSGEQVRVTIRALELVTADGEYFLEAKIELGSAPCWRSKIVGDRLRKEVEKGTLIFPALSTALGNVPKPAVVTPSAHHTVYASLVLSGKAETFDSKLGSDLETLAAQAAQVPTTSVTVHIQREVAQALLQALRTRRSEETVVDVSISDVPAGRAPDVTQSLVVAVTQGSVKAHLTERGITVKDSLVVHKPTCSETALQEAKAALEATLKDHEQQLKDAKEAQEASEGLLNADADEHAKAIEALETEVADLKERLSSSPEQCDSATDAAPTLATTPEPKTTPTAKPPLPGTKVVQEVDVAKADAGESPEPESVLDGHISPAFIVAVAFIGAALCFFFSAIRLIS